MEKYLDLPSLHIVFNTHTWVLASVVQKLIYGTLVLQIGNGNNWRMEMQSLLRLVEMAVLDFQKVCISYDTYSFDRRQLLNLP